MRLDRSLSSASTSTVSKGTPADDRICTTVLEKPHCGKSLVPLMKATTRCLVTKSSRADLSSGVRPAGPPGKRERQREREREREKRGWRLVET